MTAQDAFQGEPEAFQGTVAGYSFYRILTARGREPARCRKHRRDAQLIETDGEYEETADHSAEEIWPSILVTALTDAL